jgi:hypothetical protein
MLNKKDKPIIGGCWPHHLILKTYELQQMQTHAQQAKSKVT